MAAKVCSSIFFPLLALLPLVGGCASDRSAADTSTGTPEDAEAAEPPAQAAPADETHAAAAHGHGGPHVKTPMTREDEPHIKNLRQLTDGGENAEAYWNVSGTELSFQSTHGEMKCDQIFRMKADGSDRRQVSVGNGRTTCGYIQTDESIVYASTHGHGEGCLASPDHSQGYVWPLYTEMDIWAADANGDNARLLFQSDGYDAEATICHKDGRIIFTSTKNGDLDLYVMDKDGKNVRQLTDTPGYDGGAFFSPDCSKIIWRASRPEGQALEDYRALLAKNLVRPSALEIFVMDADGKNVVQVTDNGKANFAPYMHPDNKRLLYVSNKADPKGRDFDIYLVNVDGSGEERITHNPTFDGFPMWSHDGKKLVFASNRANKERGDTNIFVADWVD
jgi:Tol biopolymer transport system component